MKGRRNLVCILVLMTLFLSCLSAPMTGERESGDPGVVHFIIASGCG